MKVIIYLTRVHETMRIVLWIAILVLGVTSVTPSCMEKSKPLSNNLILPCPDVSGRCKWFHEVGDASSPIPLAADNSGNLVLLSNEVYSYGKFIANTTTNISGCYEVCPADSSICSNCSEIIINGVVNPSEINVCSGDDIDITLDAPWVFSNYLGGSLRRGLATLSCSSKCCPIRGTVLTHSVVYQCRNMEITDSGIYYGHISISCGSNQVVHTEWCTPNVTIIVQHSQNCSIDQSKSTLDISPSSLVVFSSSNVLLPSSMQSNNLLTSLILSSLTETLSPSPATLSPSPPTLSPSNKMNNDDNDDANTGTIVGSVLGGVALVVGILTVILVIGYLYLKKPRKKRADNH